MCEHAGGHELVASNDLAVAFADGFPLTPGHTLIVPRRHEPDFLELGSAEQAAIWTLVPKVCRWIEARGRPDGYNIGVNIGEAAGQRVGHAHLHVIPRYRGASRIRVVASDGSSPARYGTGTIGERRTRRHRLLREGP
jgi:diadenosine tetraphosphate (Ap4A) HIT family hydrolase